MWRGSPDPRISGIRNHQRERPHATRYTIQVNLAGRVYGAALNFRGTLQALGDAMYRDPHKKPPEAPVLYIKPANTWIGPDDPIPCPRGVARLRMGGTLGVVFGKRATAVTEAAALDYIGGYAVVNDVSIPHTSFFRPAIREKCRDGFCPILLSGAAAPSIAEIRIFVNGQLRATNSTANLVRPIARLIADITEFMTLDAGDILLVGEPDNAPEAAPGDRVRVEVEGVGAIENAIVEDAL